MMTSNFARCGNNARSVAISIGVPPNWHGRRYFLLAPSKEMLHMSKEDFDRSYNEKLSKLSARKVYEDICRLFGKESILLCWESPNVRCHRRIVAEWLERELGIEVTEYGFKRSEIIPYSKMLRKDEIIDKKSKKNKENDEEIQLELDFS